MKRFKKFVRNQDGLLIKNCKHHAGFTLIEVSVAMFVLAVGILGVGKMQAEISKNNSIAKQRTEAAVLAQDKIERLRNFSVLITTTGKRAFSDITTGSDSISGTNANYTRSWAITENTTPAYKKVSVSVTWTSAENSNESINLSSIIGKTDPIYSAKLFTIDPTIQTAPNLQQSVSLLIPDSAVDNGDGTSDYTPPGSSVTLTYDNTSGSVIKVNGSTAHSIVGQVEIAVGSDAPTPSKTTANVATTSSAPNIYCFYHPSSDYLANYICHVANTWSGSIFVTGTSNIKICTNTSQPYSNVIANLMSQYYLVIKKTRACSGTTPTEHQLP